MTKEEFVKELQILDPKARIRIDASKEVYKLTKALPKRSGRDNNRQKLYENGDSAVVQTS
jgi:hypothetical protein